MTPAPNVPGRPNAIPLLLPPELLDGITDALISSADPDTRADVICQLVREIYESIAWLHSAPGVELDGLRWIVEAADAHRARLATHPIPTSLSPASPQTATTV